MKSLKRTGQVIMTSVLIATIGFGGISNTVTSLFDSTPPQAITMNIEPDSDTEMGMLAQAGNLLSDIFSIPTAEASYELSPELIKAVDKVLNNFYKKLSTNSKVQQIKVLEQVAYKVDDLLKTKASKYDERSIALIEYLGQNVDAKIASLKGGTTTTTQTVVKPVVTTNPDTVVGGGSTTKPQVTNVAPVSDTLKAMQDTYKSLGGNVYTYEEAMKYISTNTQTPEMKAEVAENTAAIKKMIEDGTIPIGEVMSDSKIPLSIITGMSKDQLQQMSVDGIRLSIIAPMALKIYSERDGRTYNQFTYTNSTLPGYSDQLYGYFAVGTIERGTPLYEKYKQEVIQSYMGEGIEISTRDVPIIKLEKLPLGDNIQSKIENRETLTPQEGYDAWVTALKAEGLYDKVEFNVNRAPDGTVWGYIIRWKVDAPEDSYAYRNRHVVDSQDWPKVFGSGKAYVTRATLDYYLFDR